MHGNDAEFDAALRRAGLTVSMDRYAEMSRSYHRFCELLAVLDEPLAYTDEPATMPRPVPGVPS